MKEKHILGMLIVSVVLLFASTLFAAEITKIKLPDGLYMYDSHTAQEKEGRMIIGFGKYIIIHNNVIFDPQHAAKRFGASNLNRLFTENKKFKVLLGSEKIGEVRNVKIDDLRVDDHEKSFIKNIKQGPMYSVKDLGVRGSAARAIAVPEKYKEARTISFNAVAKDDVEKVSKLARGKLFD